jgi:hypothetical protein
MDKIFSGKPPLMSSAEWEEWCTENGLNPSNPDARVEPLGDGLKKPNRKGGGGGGNGQDPPDPLPGDPGPSAADAWPGKSVGGGRRGGEGGTAPTHSSNVSGRPPIARPQIIIRPGQTPRIVNEIEKALLTSGLPLYKRGGLLVSPGVSELPTWDKKTVIAETINERVAHTVVEDSEAVADFFKVETVIDDDGNRTKQLVQIGMASRFAHTLNARRYDLKFPVLRGITNCPSISVDGELLDQPGFDPLTGILYDPHGVVFPRVPDMPTKSEIKAAFDRILILFHTLDNDFVEPQDKGVALSTLMTAIARRGLDFAPLHGLDAPVAGSGKSMLIEIAAILLTGHGAVVMAQGEKPEEFEKRLGTVLMRGDALIANNCDHGLEGETLNQCLTQGLLQVRILGKSEMPWIQTAAFLTATGNQLQPKGDMVRRSLVGRLDPKCARPELRQYNFDPIAHAYENRPQLVRDILTLLKGHRNAGRPNHPPALQSFKHWSNTVRSCICWLACEYPNANLDDPCKTMDRVRGTDPVLTGLQPVLAAVPAEFHDTPVTTAEIIRTAEAIDLQLLILPSGTTAAYPNTNLHPQLKRLARHLWHPDGRSLEAAGDRRPRIGGHGLQAAWRLCWRGGGTAIATDMRPKTPEAKSRSEEAPAQSW